MPGPLSVCFLREVIESNRTSLCMCCLLLLLILAEEFVGDT